jgi:hypothetical protein
MRHSLLFCILAVFTVRLVHAADNAPSVTPPVPAPAFVDVVSFEFRVDGENHKVVVTTSPNVLRVDEPDDGFSILYNPRTDFYIGLEHRNYTYWAFSWPEVRAAVEKSKRNESRLQELGNEGITGDLSPSAGSAFPDSATPPAGTNASDAGTPSAGTNVPDAVPSAGTNIPDVTTSSAGSDDSGYVWHPSADRKRIGDFNCVRWTGDTISGESVEAWCYNGVLPQVQTALAHLRTIDEPVALVPVRTVVPEFVFPVYDALLKGGVTPILITWGAEGDKNHFRFLESATREGKMSLFAVPKLYMKTTLITMDGMIKEQPAQAPAKTTLPKTWQN